MVSSTMNLILCYDWPADLMPYTGNKSYNDQVCGRSRWLDIGLDDLGDFMDLVCVSDRKHAKKVLVKIFTHLC